MNVATRGLRNAFRNLTRTFAIVIILGLSIGLSLVMLIAHQAVQNKIKTSLSAIGTTITISPAGSAANIKGNTLTVHQLDKVTKIPHVANLTEIFTDKLQTNGTTIMQPGTDSQPDGGQNYAKTNLKSPLNLSNSGAVVSGGEQSDTSNFPVVFIAGTNHPTNASSIGATALHIVSGTTIDGTIDTDKAMVSRSMATKNNLNLGSTFTAYGQTLAVAAIFDSNTDSGDSYIIVSLPTAQRLSSSPGDVSEAVATVNSLNYLNSATSAIQKSLGSSADVASDVTQANDALAPLNSVKSVSLYSLIGAVIAGAVTILLTMVMIVRERRREIGILKAIGFSNVRIMLQFMCEALTFAVLGAVVGLIIGLAGGSPVTATLVSNNSPSNNTAPVGGTQHKPGAFGFTGPIVGDITNVHAQIGYSIILYGLGAAILIALIGSALASYFISSIRPAEVLRSE